MTVESIAGLTQIASTRAMGLVFDEIAVNTKMLQHIEPKRKTSAVLKVMGGSLAIKMLVIPAALALNFFLPGAIVPLLTFGGWHLATEGYKHMTEKHGEHGAEKGGEPPKKPQTPQESEKETIKKVLVIDGLLSVEITVMTLPVVAGVSVMTGGAVLALTGLIRTGWMYAVIGGIINMPRMGEWLSKREGDRPVAKAARALGRGMEKAMPYIIKGFSFAGTAALLMIGGGLLIHGIPGGEHMLHGAMNAVSSNPIVHSLISHAVGGIVGVAAGILGKPVLDRFYDLVGKGIKAGVTSAKNLFKPKDKKPSNDNKPAPAAKQEPVSSAPALQSAPDAKAALNAAAKPAVTAPASESKQQPPSPPADVPKIKP